MRYLPVCTPDFAARWFPGGATADALAAAPVIVFDRKDDLQDRYLRSVSRTALQPPRHYVPAAHEFGEAIRWGMGWGLLPEIEVLGGAEARHRWWPWTPRRTWMFRSTGSNGGTDRPPSTRSRRPSRPPPARSGESGPASRARHGAEVGCIWQELD